jgi:DNA-binding IclR family transcriptional regulator
LRSFLGHFATGRQPIPGGRFSTHCVEEFFEYNTSVETRFTKRNRGVQSVETSGLLLRLLSQAQTPLTLTRLANLAGMPSSKVYRYLVSLCRVGLVVQDARTAEYDLGELAGEIGQTFLTRSLRGHAIQARLHELCADLTQTVCLFQLTAEGPVVKHVEQFARPITTRSRLGLALPLLTTATGRVYAAFGDGPVIQRRVRAEMRALREEDIRSLRSSSPQTMLAETRHRGLARICGEFRSGTYAIAAPVFDEEKRLRAVVSAIGERDLDVGWNSKVASALRRFAAAISSDVFLPA